MITCQVHSQGDQVNDYQHCGYEMLRELCIRAYGIEWVAKIEAQNPDLLSDEEMEQKET